MGSRQGRHVAGGGREAALSTLRGSGLLEGWVSLSRVKQVLIAQAEAEKIRKIGEAEAFVIEAIGMAEAERMKLKAEALKKYGEAAQLALVLDALPEVRREQLCSKQAVGSSQPGPGLRGAQKGPTSLGRRLLSSSLALCSSCPPSLPPQIAAKVAAPLSKVDEIVILSGESSNTTSEVNRLLAEIPASVRAITGVDLTKVSPAPAAGNACGSWGRRTCLKAFRLLGSLPFPSPAQPQSAGSSLPPPPPALTASLFPSCRFP